MTIGLLTVILMARALGPEQFGVFNYVLALVMLFSELSSMGLNAILVKEIVHNSHQTSKVLGTALVLRVIGGLLTLGFSMLLIKILRPDEKGVMLLVAIIACGVIFRSLDVVDFYFQSKIQSKYVVLAKIQAYTVTFLFVYLLVIWNGSLNVFVAVRATEFALIALGLVLFYKRLGNRLQNWHFDVQLAKRLLRQSWPLILSGLSAGIYLKIDQIMLGQMLGEATVGIYAVASQLSEIWYFIPLAIASSFFPGLIRSRQENQEAYRRRLQHLYDFLAGLAMIIAVLISLTAEWLVSFLYGEEYRTAGKILSIHIWAGPFVFMRATFSKWLILENLFMFSLVTHLCGAMINVLANFILIPSLGGLGAASATVISYAAAGYFSLFLHHKTRSSAYMMTLALLMPLRLAIKRESVH
jgi:PST family polysaccharide transporter